ANSEGAGGDPAGASSARGRWTGRPADCRWRPWWRRRSTSSRLSRSKGQENRWQSQGCGTQSRAEWMESLPGRTSPLQAPEWPQVVVPISQEADHRERGDRGAAEGQHDGPEDPQASGPIDEGCLFHLARDAHEELAHEEDSEHPAQAWQDEGGIAVEESDHVDDSELRREEHP